jgi:hypothetical protein
MLQAEARSGPGFLFRALGTARRRSSPRRVPCRLPHPAMGDWMKSFNDIAGYAKNAAQQASTMVAGSELEKKLAEATSNEPWGASSARCSPAFVPLRRRLARAPAGWNAPIFAVPQLSQPVLSARARANHLLHLPVVPQAPCWERLPVPPSRTTTSRR